MARDCTQKRDPNGFNSPTNNGFGTPPQSGPTPGVGGKFDSEYASLMAELGEGGAGGGAGGGSYEPTSSAPWNREGGSAAPDTSGGYIPPGFTTVPPWRRPDVWQTPSAGPSNGVRPQQGYGGAGYNYPGGYAGGQAQGYGGGQWQQGQAGYPQQGYGYQQTGQANYASYYQGAYDQQHT